MKEFWVGAAALGAAVALLTLGKNYKDHETCTEKVGATESEIEECGVEFIASKKEIDCEPVIKSANAKAKGKEKNANKKLTSNGKDESSDDVVTVELDESTGNNDGFMFI